MEAVKAAAVAGERKAVTSVQPRSGESCSASGSFDPVTAKSETGDAEGECARRSGLQCSVPCMPVVNRAVNQITWNHLLLWGSAYFSSEDERPAKSSTQDGKIPSASVATAGRISASRNPSDSGSTLLVASL